jgi:hypothetical protein
MNTIRIDYEDGNHVVTDFNGTLAEAEAYYVGQKFQFGDTEDCPEDKLVKAIKVTEVFDPLDTFEPDDFDPPTEYPLGFFDEPAQI